MEALRARYGSPEALEEGSLQAQERVRDPGRRHGWVCDRCGSRFYTTDILHRVQEVATGAVAPERFDEIPVAPAR